MSIITVTGTQATQKDIDQRRAETIARQYQQGQKVPAGDVAWLRTNYPSLLNRGTEKPYSPAASFSYQAQRGPASGWTYTGPMAKETPPSGYVVPKGVNVIVDTGGPKLISGGPDIIGSIGKGLQDIGAALSPKAVSTLAISPLLSSQEVSALASGKPSEVWKVETPKLTRQAELAVAAGSIVAAPVTIGILGGSAAAIAAAPATATLGVFGSLGIGEALNIGLTGKPLSREAGAQAMAIGGVFSLGTLGIQSIVSSTAARSALIGGMGAGFGYITGGPKGALIGGLASGLGYAGLEKVSGFFSEKGAAYLTGKYMKSLEDVSDYIGASGEPEIQGIQEWKGLPEKLVSFVTGAKPSGLAVGEVVLPDVPMAEQLRLAVSGVEKVPAMDAFELTIAPRTGGVAYTKPDLAAIEEIGSKLPTYFGIGESLISEKDILSEGKTAAGFEKGAAEQWQDKVSALTKGIGGTDLGSFERTPYTTGFSAKYGFEKPFYPPETGLTPLVTQTQLTRMGIFPDIPKSIPDLSGAVTEHLDSIAAISGGLAGGMAALTQSLQIRPLQSKISETPFTMPKLWPDTGEEEKQYPVPFPILGAGQVPIQETPPYQTTPTVPRIPTFPTPPTPKTDFGIPITWPRLGGGERTFGRRPRKGLWIPRVHAIPTFSQVAVHFGIKGFGSRGIRGDRFGMDKSILYDQNGIAGYGKRGPVRVSNKVPKTYKGMRMRDRLRTHERVERKLRLEKGLSYPAAHRRALKVEHKGLTRKQIGIYEGKIWSVKHQINNSGGDPFRRLLEKIGS